MKTVQDMEVEFNKEIGELKKVHGAIKLDMKNLGSQTKTSEVSLPREYKG